MTRWVGALLVAVVLGPWAGSADAHHHHHRHHARHAAVQKRYSPISAAYTIAARYWGAQPCNGDVAITVDQPPPGMAVTQYAVPGMWSSWNPGSASQNSESAPQPFNGCRIALNAEAWPTETFEAYTAWPEFAVQMIHEVGHLLGHEHSTDPASVMYAGPLSAKPAITGEYAPGWG